MKVCACGVVLIPVLALVTGRPEPNLQITVEDVEVVDDPEITEGFFEGDIELPTSRNAIVNLNRRWPNGTVSYKISSEYPPTAVATFLAAMREIENNTRHGDIYCIRFIERIAEQDYVYIKKLNGCHSAVGRHGGAQTLSLGRGCWGKGTAMHELNHALGFWHEQNRSDRDDYVIVHSDNIPADKHGAFAKKPVGKINLLGSPYDYGSIMHYGPYAFAVDKSKPTMSPKPGVGTGLTMGQRHVMSTQDVWRIQKLYGCPIDTTHIARPPTAQIVTTCNFETDLCGLKQDSADDFDWTRHKGPTATNNTGPMADHTNGGGYYLYAEANGHHKQRARLLTSTVPGGRYCLEFFLFLHGGQQGSFQVLAAGARIREQALKTISGDHMNKWLHKRVNLDVPLDFHIILQATVGSGDESDIVIDDFTMSHGRCL